MLSTSSVLVMDLSAMSSSSDEVHVASVVVRVAGAAVADAFEDPVAADLGRVLAVAELGVSDADAWR